MQFQDFLDALSTDENQSLIESIKVGYSTIFEGWCDVRSIEKEPAIQTFSRKAAMNALGMGIPVIQKLNEWAEQNSSRYSYDEEEVLDHIDTLSQFRDMMPNSIAPVTQRPDAHLGINGVPKTGF